VLLLDELRVVERDAFGYNSKNVTFKDKPFINIPYLNYSGGG
jgi:hypothetical protein